MNAKRLLQNYGWAYRKDFEEYLKEGEEKFVREFCEVNINQEFLKYYFFKKGLYLTESDLIKKFKSAQELAKKVLQMKKAEKVFPKKKSVDLYNNIFFSDSIKRLKKMEEKIYIDSKYKIWNSNKLEVLKKNEELINSTCTVIFIDGNNLKKINKTKGHLAGDEYIKTIIKIIDRSLKYLPANTDSYICRINCGDEIAVIIKGNYRGIVRCMQRLLGSTAAAGYVIKAPRERFEKVLLKADRKMYIEKRRIKNDGPHKNRRNFCEKKFSRNFK